MAYAEMSQEQRRQIVDAEQLHRAWWPVFKTLANDGSLFWNTSHGKRYLYRKQNGRTRSLGRETQALTRRKELHDLAKERIKPLTRKIEMMAPVNKAMRLARIPAIAAAVIRQIDLEGLLGSHLIVTGTNALYAYEAAAGVFIGGSHVATNDADFLWDTKQSLLLAASNAPDTGFIGLLRRVDRTFTADFGFNATNSDGYIVDLLCPESEHIQQMRPSGDIEDVAMLGASWLLEAPQLEAVIIGGDGIPVRIVVPEPRTYALHKLWVSKRADRSAVKRPRDRAHAAVATRLATNHLNLSFNAEAMPWLPKELKSLLGEVARLPLPDDA